MQKSEKKIRLEQLSIESEIKRKKIYIYISSENAAVFRIEDFYQFQVSKAVQREREKKRRRKKKNTEGKNATNLTFYIFFLFVFIYIKKKQFNILVHLRNIYSTLYPLKSLTILIN